MVIHYIYMYLYTHKAKERRIGRVIRGCGFLEMTEGKIPGKELRERKRQEKEKTAWRTVFMLTKI